MINFSHILKFNFFSVTSHSSLKTHPSCHTPSRWSKKTNPSFCVTSFMNGPFQAGKKFKKMRNGRKKNCHVCQQKENKSQKLYCVFLFIYICLILPPEMYLFAV